jgi:uncharacterized protein YegL
MSGLESDTIGGYNSMLNKQKQEPGEAVITTVLFDDKYELLHDRINLKGVVPITEKEYFVRGSTALLDAVGLTINKIGNVQKHTVEEERAQRVLIIITTDGMENSSTEFSYKKIQEMIENQKSEYGWEFIFLGANIDAIATAKRFGIDKEYATNYNADSKGTMLNYEVISNTISCFRATSSLSKNWKESIEKDFEKRGSKKNSL